MATKRSVTRFSIKCQENPDNGRDSVYWCVFVKTSCKRRQPGDSVHRRKSSHTQQLPGESEKDYADFSSKILHLQGDRKDFEFVKASLSGEGFDVYDINGYGLRHILENCSEVQA